MEKQTIIYGICSQRNGEHVERNLIMFRIKISLFFNLYLDNTPTF